MPVMRLARAGLEIFPNSEVAAAKPPGSTGNLPIVFGQEYALSAEACFGSLSSPKGGEGRGEEAIFHPFPLSPTLSPLVPRGEREDKRPPPFFMPNTTGNPPVPRGNLPRRTGKDIRWFWCGFPTPPPPFRPAGSPCHLSQLRSSRLCCRSRVGACPPQPACRSNLM